MPPKKFLDKSQDLYFERSAEINKIEFDNEELFLQQLSHSATEHQSGAQYRLRKNSLPNIKDTEYRKSVRLVGPSSVQDHKPLSLNDFILLNVLGEGSFGKVYLAKAREKYYAIKILRKDKILSEDWALEKTK